MGFFTGHDRAHRSSLGLLCLLSEKEAATPSWCFGAQQKGERGEKCFRRKTAPAKNGTGEKLALAKNIAREILRRNMLPAKFATTNARKQNCRGNLLR